MTPPKMSVENAASCSVIIPTCNEGKMLHETVVSVLEDSAYDRLEVIVVDDGSTDGSADALTSYGPSVQVVRGSGLGLPRAKNLGAERASGDVIVFLDAHCRAFPGWLHELVAALAPADVALAGPSFRSLAADQPRGCGMTWVTDHLETAWFETPDRDDPYEVPLLPGGSQAFRRETFAHIGRFDEGMTRWGFEDVEISLRAWLLGYRVLAVPKSLIAHDFRQHRNFEVEDEGVLYNYLRLLHLHFSPRRIAHSLAAMPANNGVGNTLQRLLQTDVLELRRELEAVRVRNDDWFFATFAPTLAVAKPAPATKWPIHSTPSENGPAPIRGNPCPQPAGFVVEDKIA